MKVLNFLMIIVIGQADGQRKLNDQVLHYEGLYYNTEKLHRQHSRVSRSVDSHVMLEFESHGQTFPIKLRNDRTTFSKDHDTMYGGTTMEHEVTYMYEGHIIDQPGSKVHGSILNGRFSGVIHSHNDTFYIDKREYHFDEPQDFHSVIYKDRDIVRDPHERQACGHEIHEIHQKMELESSLANPRLMYHQTHNIYGRATNRKSGKIGKERTCPLYLQTDTMLWEEMKKRFKKSDDVAVKEEITALLGMHVQAARNIFEDTDFKLGIRGITFTIRRTRINTTIDCEGTKATHNPFCSRNIDVSMFLNLNSYQNHDDYCLAYIFTYRDFMGGTLGLAWVGNPSGSAGGICEKKRTLQEEGGVLLEKSTNTGIVTLINYGKPVVSKVSHLTFAHEIGHNFGSPHDAKTSQCQPYSESKSPEGNYIMFPSATSGNRPNNIKFSPCSIGNMSLVLEAVMSNKHGKQNCFVDEKTEFCGNGIKEGDEECDCGFHGYCDDECCYARDDPQHPDKKCMRKVGVQCSPSEGPCCTKQCKFKNATTCSYKTDCAKISYCTGDKASCPAPQPEPTGTPCNDNTQICQNGTCSGSICSAIDWEECSITTENKAEMCHLGCRPANNETCFSSGGTNLPAKIQELMNNISNNEPIILQPGAPCNNLQGYCDSLGKCRGIDANGPLARLKELLFNPATYDLIIVWITEHWWAVALIILGVILLMGGFIKVCSVHTPSTNPNKPKAQKISHTLRRVSVQHYRNRNRARPDRSIQPSAHQMESGNRQGERPKTQAPTRQEHAFRRPVPSAPPSYRETTGHDNRYFREYEMRSQRI